MISPQDSNNLTRRHFLRDTAGGLGAIALADLMSDEGQLVATEPAINPLASRLAHFAPKAKQVIFLFMAGAPSQLDLFTPKPKLQTLHGQPVPNMFLEGLEDKLIQGSAAFLDRPGSSRRWVSAAWSFLIICLTWLPVRMICV